VVARPHTCSSAGHCDSPDIRRFIAVVVTARAFISRTPIAAALTVGPANSCAASRSAVCAPSDAERRIVERRYRSHVVSSSHDLSVSAPRCTFPTLAAEVRPTTSRVVAIGRCCDDADRMNRDKVIDTYLQAYGEPDAAKRASLVGTVFAPNAVLADPPFVATGADEIVGAFGAVQAQLPGHRFARTSEIDEHHGCARYAWALNATDGSTSVAGVDFVRFDDAGLIVSVAGFFGELTQRTSP
jgi:SnoaL-like domain